MQQLPSDGQSASESMSSQNRAKRPLTHSPLHGFKVVGFRGVDEAVLTACVVVARGLGVVLSSLVLLK